MRNKEAKALGRTLSSEELEAVSGGAERRVLPQDLRELKVPSLLPAKRPNFGILKPTTPNLNDLREALA